MVYLIHHDRRTDVTHCWKYVFEADAKATFDVLSGDLKYVLRNVEDLHRAQLPVLVLKQLFEDMTGKPLRWNNRHQAEKKVYTAMGKLTKEEVTKAQKAVAPISPSPESVAGQVAAENETAEQKEERERLALEKQLLLDQKRVEAEKKKLERLEAKRLRDEANAARKKKREEEKAARAAAKANGPVDCPHSARIKVIKEQKDWPQFKGNRAIIVGELKDGMTVGEFVKAAAKAVPGAGVGDVRIYLEKGMIQLEKAPEAPVQVPDAAAASAEPEQPAA